MSQSLASTEKIDVTALYDLAALRRQSCQIARIRALQMPSIAITTPPARRAETAPLLLLPGSYNPPTTAHLALARASLQAIPQASLSLVLGTTIINKVGIERATLLDRLVLLNQIARRTCQMGVFLTNQGLFVEQAKAARAAFPKASEILFVVGYDKIEQIFDARYYQDRDAALKQLFALAGFLVAPRADHEAADLAALLRQPGNQQFQESVRVLPFPVEYREVSSSQIRAAFAALQAHPTDLTASPLAELLPPEALTFVRETGCYSPPQPIASGERIDRYELRTSLIACALALPKAEQDAIDLQRLIRLATSATAAGHLLRQWLSQPEAAQSPHDLLLF